jgi:hypothetical protein
MGMKGGRSKYSEREGACDPAWRVDIAIGPSRLVAIHVAVVAGAGVASVFLAGLEGAMGAGAAAALGLAAAHALRREALRRGRGAVRRLVVDLAGRVEVVSGDGARVTGQVVPGSFVAPWLVVVRWRPEGRRFTRPVLVPPDAVDGDAFRRLRVLLRWGPSGDRGGTLAV